MDIGTGLLAFAGGAVGGALLVQLATTNGYRLRNQIIMWYRARWLEARADHVDIIVKRNLPYPGTLREKEYEPRCPKCGHMYKKWLVAQVECQCPGIRD